MRLLHIESLDFTEFRRDNKRPRYVIASHRWHEESEVTFQDVQNRRNMDKDGYKKIAAFAKYVREHIPFVEWLWIDTCCINKDSAAELSEAVNLMFEWYRDAALCIAYLMDVQSAEDESSFEKSEWFKRGWTLQELLAPRKVVFVTQGWQIIGSKGDVDYDQLETPGKRRLEKDLARITGIPEHVLHDFSTSSSLSIDERLKWMEGRSTTRAEDMSYALYGLFDVAPGANYGEKYERAKQRLLAAIHNRGAHVAKQHERFLKIVEWLSPADPWTNHNSARSFHEPQTGTWLLESNQYRHWRLGATRLLWVYGKAGCGKTILCSTAIEDIKEYCQHHPTAGYAVFYFSFSDDRKQSLSDLLRSLVAQLGWKGPALSMLQQAYDSPNRNQPGLEELEKILFSCFEAFDEVFLFLDALDECPEGEDVRHSMLECLARLSKGARCIRILATSRELLDIHTLMATLESEAMPLATRSVDADIRQYVAKGLARNHRLSRLDQKTKALIEETISAKADGMFRWAYCQLQELKKLKSTRPSVIMKALSTLPATLDETYERILVGIEREARMDAMKLLRWLVYAKSPLSLGELVDATVIDLAAVGSVEVEDRPGLDDPLEILAGLVMIVGDDRDDYNAYKEEDVDSQWLLSQDDRMNPTSRRQQVDRDIKVRLAHFSVKEYLESERILESCVRDFNFKSAREHRILTQSCLTYLRHYSSSEQKLSTKEDLTTFPLLRYVAESWFYHGALQESENATIEVAFLCTEANLRDWLQVRQPDQIGQGSFCELKDIGSSLYYASFLGLELAVSNLLHAGAHVNAQGGHFGNALQAASVKGHEKVVQMLINAGAEINAAGGEHGNALQAASADGHDKVVRLLLEAGSNVNALRPDHRSALHVAARKGQATVVQLLLEHDATMTADYNNMTPLHYAVQQGFEGIIEIILGFGTPVDLTVQRQIWRSTWDETGRCWKPKKDPNMPLSKREFPQGLTPLHYAALVGNLKMTRFLLDQGANPQAISEYGETPLHLVLKADLYGPDWGSGNEDHWNDPAFRIEFSLNLMDPPDDDENDEYYMVQAEIDQFRCEIADVLYTYHSAKFPIHDHYGATPLHCVPYGRRYASITLATLLSGGLEVDLCDKLGRTALQLACWMRDVEAVGILLSHGAKSEIVDNDGMNALHYAAQSGHDLTARLILQRLLGSAQASLAKTRDSRGRNALHILLGGDSYVDIAAVKLLISSGVELNDLTSDEQSPLALYLSKPLARSRHKAEIASYLFESGADPLFRRSTDGKNLGHLAAHADKVGIVLLKTLADYGVDLRAEDDDGRTILHHCAIAGSLEDHDALSFLFDTVEVSHDAVDRFGKTPMDLVLEKEQKVKDKRMFRPDRWHRMLNLLFERIALTEA